MSLNQGGLSIAELMARAYKSGERTGKVFYVPPILSEAEFQALISELEEHRGDPILAIKRRHPAWFKGDIAYPEDDPPLSGPIGYPDHDRAWDEVSGP